MSFLSLRGVSKYYGEIAAVRDISLDVAKGEFLTLLGPSGSGKSTALYMIAGFEDPSHGEILLNGRSLAPVPPNERQIGMVFQRYTLFPHLSVEDNIAFPLKVRRRPRAEIAAKVADMLRLTRLEAFARRMPGQLSGGQQQRVALARALAYDPPLLLMDEPLSALDKKLREEIQVEIKRIHYETGVTILYVTHDQEEALRLSDRVALFNHGAIVQIGAGRDLYERPASRFVADFIGHSSFLRATLERREGALGRVVFPDGASLDGVALASEIDVGTAVAVMLRPDQVHLADEGLAATVTAATYLGDCLALVAATSWGENLDLRLKLGAADSLAPQVGDQICLRCEPSRVRVFARSG